MEEETTILRLCETSTIDEVSNLYQTIRARGGGSGPVTVDCASVTRVDASVMQLLWGLYKEIGDRLQWLNMNETILKAAELLGMQEMVHGGR